MRSDVPDAIGTPKVVAIARGLEADELAWIAEALLAGGVRAFEVTLNSPGALGGIDSLARRFKGSPLLLGAGTVLDVDAAEAAQAAGARFLVTPHCDLALIEWAANRDLPVFPGAMTPTEILSAWRAGATAVKLFPASVVGFAHVREMRGPFPHIPLIPTGGVTLDNAPGFIAAGATAVGVGTWLTGADPTDIAERAVRLVRAVQHADGGLP